MLPTMATTRKPRATTPRTPRSTGHRKPVAAKPEGGRRKTKLTLVADEAARKFLLATLKEHGWNLTRAAEALDMAGAPAVLKAIRSLDLADAYQAAKDAGKAKPGRPAE